MSDELFDVPTVLSPRLAWIEKHRVSTNYCNLFSDIPPWCAWTGDLETAMSRDAVESADTEDEALVALAKRMRVRLWNEEGV